jgi:hypothetical protein
MSKTPAKILFVDIETAPSLGWVWGKWEQNVIDFKSDWYMLSIAWRWSHESRVHTLGLNDFKEYKVDPEDDFRLVEKLWHLLDEADIVVAHNGDGFDLPKANTRFILHKFEPPSPYKTVDTLKIARNKFKFDSNKLDDLGRYLNIGRKLPHTGFNLWRGCMTGDEKSWTLMKRYNGHDVELLVKLYYLIRAWHPTHPNVNHGETACPKCASFNVQRRGFSYTAQRKKQRWHCQNCAGWFEGSARKV